MKKIQHLRILFIVATIALYSCQKQDLTDVKDLLDEPKQKVSSYVIPMEVALDDLYSLLDQLSVQGKNTKRRTNVKKTGVETVYFDRTAKKMGGSPARKSGSFVADPVLYLVNFDDGGFAVLSADVRIPASIIAITDNGSINSSDFLKDYGVFNPDDELDGFQLYDPVTGETYVGALEGFHTHLVHDFVLDYVDGGSSGGGSGSSSTATFRTEYSAWTVTKQTPRLTAATTHWHQGSPYNSQAPIKGIFNKKQAPVGCVALAVAQIMDYTGHLNAVSGSTSYHKLRTIGNGCNTLYTKNWSFAFPACARNYLASRGFKNVVRHHGYNETRILNMLDANNPVFFAAISGLFNGHAWVIDGERQRVRTKSRINNQTGQVVSTETETELSFHCNWGWGGTSNGYYVSGIFNPPGHNYKWAFHTITYNR
jgi:hypothetical protein